MCTSISETTEGYSLRETPTCPRASPPETQAGFHSEEPRKISCGMRKIIIVNYVQSLLHDRALLSRGNYFTRSYPTWGEVSSQNINSSSLSVSPKPY